MGCEIGEGKIIWALIFLFPQQSIFSLKTVGGRKGQLINYLGL